MILASAGFAGIGGGCVLLFFALVVLLVFGVSVLAFFQGIDWYFEKPYARRCLGVLSICVGVLLPPSLCFGPSIHFRFLYASPPLNDVPTGLIREGMSSAEVRTLLGPPHEIARSDRLFEVKWTYWKDAIKLDYFCIIFGEDGKVTAAYQE